MKKALAILLSFGLIFALTAITATVIQRISEKPNGETVPKPTGEKPSAAKPAENNAGNNADNVRKSWQTVLKSIWDWVKNYDLHLVVGLVFAVVISFTILEKLKMLTLKNGALAIGFILLALAISKIYGWRSNRQPASAKSTVDPAASLIAEPQTKGSWTIIPPLCGPDIFSERFSEEIILSGAIKKWSGSSIGCVRIRQIVDSRSGETEAHGVDYCPNEEHRKFPPHLPTDTIRLSFCATTEEYTRVDVWVP